MQPNLFYLGGPHGAGKTTLSELLAKENPRIMLPELYSRNIKFHTDPYYRQVLKVCNRAIENFEYLKIAKDNPDKIVIGNRSIYDVLAYNWVYYARGWISKQTWQQYDEHAKDFFRNENSEPNAIIVNPDLDIVLKHLGMRWEKKGKKWREDDTEYARLACEAYKRLQGKPNIYYIDKEINFSKSVLDSVNSWLLSLSEPKKIYCYA
ncbi:deoxynucleoside kinase [Candidatus Woesearchaeota archaeon]|nr:deoxynucleoside kinase [Candidatus Woesearchaeota archaeon]